MEKSGATFIPPLTLKNSSKRMGSFRSFSSPPSKKQHTLARESSNVGSSDVIVNTHEDIPARNTSASVIDNVPPLVPSASENDNTDNIMNEIEQEMEIENEIEMRMRNEEVNPIKKGRGKNKCGALAKLKQGNKLEIDFFNRRGVGENSSVFVRKMGIIYRDPSIVHVQVKKWKDLNKDQLDHIWASVQNDLEKALEDNPDISDFEFIEKAFGPQTHGSVVCLGGGVEPKDFKQKSVKNDELAAKLREAEEEKANLEREIETIKTAARIEAEQQKQRMDDIGNQVANMQAQMRAIMDAQKVLFPNVLGSYNVIAGWGNFVMLLTDVCLMGLRYSSWGNFVH
ncbi:hypothetical protein LINGRAHAP2_LOCUS15268 [Linum grandiflorum]